MSDTDPHKLAHSVVIEHRGPPHRRRNILVDGELFPYYTQGDIEVRDAQGGTMKVVLIPLICDTVAFVELPEEPEEPDGT